MKQASASNQYELFAESCDVKNFRKFVEALPDEKLILSVSEWSESKRYLPQQVSTKPGYYRFNVTPYLKEIADCMSLDSPVREIDFMKGAQIGATVGILENTIGYCIDHVKSAPVMLLTADAELAKMRIDSYITPMLEHSGLNHLIGSADTTSTRKTGKTDKRIEWEGGGFLVPLGAINPAKIRSLSIQYLLEDEVDAYPNKIGSKNEDPQKTAEARTKAYHESRKIARISTPLLKNSSRIFRGYMRGDQRKYFVPCRGCNVKQVLKFQGLDGETGKVWGLTWKLKDSGALDLNSVKYICEHCGHEHVNSDKTWMLSNGEWRPTAVARSPHRRSYQLSALYSPVGMFPWYACVLDWLDAWDTKTNKVNNIGLLQEFYNNILGRPFENIGSSVSFKMASNHRRTAYQFGQVPNKYATQYCGSHILFLICTVDVHKNNLAVMVTGFTRDHRIFVVDYWRFRVDRPSGDPFSDDLSSSVWGRLRELIANAEYIADDGKIYKIALTLVDAGYVNDTVIRFCHDYESGVYPIYGRPRPSKNQTVKEFGEYETSIGTVGFGIVVDHYKDRLASILRREWHEETGIQRPFHYNAPVDMTDKQLNELTAETLEEKTDSHGNVSQVYVRKGDNEQLDLLVYALAGADILAYNICIKHFQLDSVQWPTFWDFIDSKKLFYG